MGTDIRKHTAPLSGETPSRQVINNLSLSINDVIPVANVTARAQLVADLTAAGFTPSQTKPLYVHRADAGAGLELEVTTDGTSWRTFPASAWSRLDTTNALVRTITQWGIIRIAGAGTTSITGALTYPQAFATSLPPHVSTNIMGYRTTGAYNPNGLTSTGIESWVSKAYAVSNSAASILVASSVAIAAGFDIYVSWSATGQAA